MKELAGIRIDSVFVTRIEIEPAADMNNINVLVTFYDSKGNQNIASANPTGIWSVRTNDALRSLIDSIEGDVVEQVTGGEREASGDQTETGGGLFEKP